MTNSIKPAATIVSLNLNTKWPHETLLVKRSLNSAFLPGAYVFPGGRFHQKDELFSQWLNQDEPNSQRISSSFIEKNDAMLALACALRECQEEAGFWHFSRSQTQPPDLSNFYALSWWQTPEGETRRFDTKFFLSLVTDANLKKPEENQNLETFDPIWINPQKALDKHQNKEIFLPPPTRAILHAIARAPDFLSLLDKIDHPIRPIKPFFIEENEQKILILPGDKKHSEQQKSKLFLETRMPFI